VGLEFVKPLDCLTDIILRQILLSQLELNKLENVINVDLTRHVYT
jgi:hypothetical protein